jgi:hypothetical protein
MPIKYAEIIISRNLEEETWLTYFKNLIGEEDIITINDTIIVSFEDGTVSDTKCELTDNHFKFGPIGHRGGVYPEYFNNNRNDKLFVYKWPKFKDDVMKLDFNSIFKDYSKYKTIKKTASVYNAIYFIGTQEVLAIVKNGNKYKYLLAYDDSFIDKLEINYFVNILFTNSFTYEK